MLLYKYWDLLSANSPNKHKSNLIGHTIFLTREKYPMTNQKPDTILFHEWENSNRFFPPFGAVMWSNWEWMLQHSLLSQKHGFKVCRHYFRGTIYRGPRKRKCKKKTQQNIGKSSLSQVSECSTTTVHSASSVAGLSTRPASNIDLYRCCSVMVVNSESLSAAIINHRPWPLQKLT